MRTWRSLLEGVRWRLYLYSLPAQVWAGFMLAMAITPDLGPLENVVIMDHQDKVFHAVEYLILSILLALALVKADGMDRAFQLKVSFFLPTVYGVFLEAVQPLVPYRDASGLDALANILGAAVGATLAVYVLAPRIYPETGSRS